MDATYFIRLTDSPSPLYWLFAASVPASDRWWGCQPKVAVAIPAVPASPCATRWICTPRAPAIRATTGATSRFYSLTSSSLARKKTRNQRDQCSFISGRNLVRNRKRQIIVEKIRKCKGYVFQLGRHAVEAISELCFDSFTQSVSLQKENSQYSSCDYNRRKLQEQPRESVEISTCYNLESLSGNIRPIRAISTMLVESEMSRKTNGKWKIRRDLRSAVFVYALIAFLIARRKCALPWHKDRLSSWGGRMRDKVYSPRTISSRCRPIRAGPGWPRGPPGPPAVWRTRTGPHCRSCRLSDARRNSGRCLSPRDSSWRIPCTILESAWTKSVVFVCASPKLKVHCVSLEQRERRTA